MGADINLGRPIVSKNDEEEADKDDEARENDFAPRACLIMPLVKTKAEQKMKRKAARKPQGIVVRTSLHKKTNGSSLAPCTRSYEAARGTSLVRVLLVIFLSDTGKPAQLPTRRERRARTVHGTRHTAHRFSEASDSLFAHNGTHNNALVATLCKCA